MINYNYFSCDSFHVWDFYHYGYTKDNGARIAIGSVPMQTSDWLIN